MNYGLKLYRYTLKTYTLNLKKNYTTFFMIFNVTESKYIEYIKLLSTGNYLFSNKNEQWST